MATLPAKTTSTKIDDRMLLFVFICNCYLQTMKLNHPLLLKPTTIPFNKSQYQRSNGHIKQNMFVHMPETKFISKFNCNILMATLLDRSTSTKMRALLNSDNLMLLFVFFCICYLQSILDLSFGVALFTEYFSISAPPARAVFIFVCSHYRRFWMIFFFFFE